MGKVTSAPSFIRFLFVGWGGRCSWIHLVSTNSRPEVAEAAGPSPVARGDGQEGRGATTKWKWQSWKRWTLGQRATRGLHHGQKATLSDAGIQWPLADYRSRNRQSPCNYDLSALIHISDPARPDAHLSVDARIHTDVRTISNRLSESRLERAIGSQFARIPWD